MTETIESATRIFGQFENRSQLLPREIDETDVRATWGGNTKTPAQIGMLPLFPLLPSL